MSLKKMGKKTRLGNDWQMAAQVLAKRTAVEVFEADLLELPGTVQGIAYREGRKGVIVLSNLTGSQQYYEARLKTFLHEIAHMRLHFKRLGEYKNGKPVRPGDPDPKIEVEAVRLAKAWWTLMQGKKDEYLVPFAAKTTTWEDAMLLGLATTLKSAEADLAKRKNLKGVALRQALDQAIVWAAEELGVKGLKIITQETHRALRKQAH